MSKIEGGCLCGAIRYTTNAKPIMTVLCNCKNCQRQAGSAFSIIVAVPRGALQVRGQPTIYNDTGDSGMRVVRKFCNQCGSPLISEPEATPKLDWVKAGTLDDTSWLKPTVNLWCDSAQAWMNLNEDIPRFGKNPPMG